MLANGSTFIKLCSSILGTLSNDSLVVFNINSVHVYKKNLISISVHSLLNNVHSKEGVG